MPTMSLKVVGAGLGRTGTHSLKIALEKLLGKPCYHMIEVFSHPQHIPTWQAAAEGKPVHWPDVMSEYAAAVDWPASAYYKELAETYPDALVLLSVRSSESWWKSVNNTIFKFADDPEAMSRMDPNWFKMVTTMFQNRFTTQLSDRDACIAAYERHNEEVKRAIPAERLLVWTAADGYEPICKRLGLPVPSEPFPLTNTTEEFLAHHGPPPITQ
jgi:hypothetical protein